MTHRIFLMLLLALTISRGFGQNASKYLNLDTSITIYYQLYSGDTIQERFSHQKVYGSDTVCFYHRLTKDGDTIGQLYYAFRGDYLIKGSHFVNRHFDGPTQIDLTIKVPKEGEQTDTSCVISFDMDVSYFDQTNYIEPKYEIGKHKKFKKVLVVDQHNAK